MQAEAILYPLFAMVALTFIIAIRGYAVRIRAVKQDGLSPGYFLYNRGAKPPEYLLRSEQNFTNLFELPTLFYAAIILTYITSLTDISNILLAWMFVLGRFMHSYTHIRHNKLLVRRNYFLFGFIVLMVFWIKLLVQVVFLTLNY